MDQAPIKSIAISGNLKNNDLKYILCPSTEFSEGVWYISISSVAFSTKTTIGEICEISCNLVKGQKYKKDSYEVELYNQPFGVFLFEAATQKKKIVYLGPTFKYKF